MLRSLLLTSLLLASASADDCKRNEWQCFDGTCIKLSQRCNNKRDCPLDTSDEENCDPTATCSPTEFVCDNGRCLSASSRCNNEFDCADMTDELNCDGVCLPGNFHCSDGKCIPESQRCDNNKDCSDDELHCVGCPANEFQCVDKTCVPIRMRCNGYPECKDRSDELNCPSGPPNGTKPVIDVTGRKTGGASRRPVHSSGCQNDDGSRCDEENDRRGASDSTRTLGDYDTAHCTEKEFKCFDNTCVSIQKRCDSHNDCEDRSDEENCIVNDKVSTVNSMNGSCNCSFRYTLSLCTWLFVMSVLNYI